MSLRGAMSISKKGETVYVSVRISAHASGFTSREIPVMTSRGSMTLPRDLLIFLPWASLTTACRYTWRPMLPSHQVATYARCTACAILCFIFWQLWLDLPPWRAACRSVWGPSSPYEPPRRTGCHGLSPARCQGRTHSGPVSKGRPQTPAFMVAI